MLLKRHPLLAHLLMINCHELALRLDSLLLLTVCDCLECLRVTRAIHLLSDLWEDWLRQAHAYSISIAGRVRHH